MEIRSIIFRGQTRRKGEKIRLDGTPIDSNWVYGGVAQLNEERAMIYQTEPDFQKFAVYADTVGQYTGLTDKNGKMIFEGDIVRRFNSKGQEVMRYVVEWNADCCMFVLMCEDKYLGEYHTDFTVFYGKEVEIIGNIHDNGELLKGE